jgi:hypothetical protein
MHNEKKPNISKKCKNKGEKNTSIMVFSPYYEMLVTFSLKFKRKNSLYLSWKLKNKYKS